MTFPPQKRLVIARSVLALRGLAIADGKQYSNEMLLHLVMAIGRLEGKSPDAAAIAASIGVSRQTIIRALQKMQAEGVLTIQRHGKRMVPVTTDDFRESEAVQRFYAKVELIFVETARQLSNLDTKSLDGDQTP